MYETGVVALVGELADTDPAACDRAGLASLVAVSQRVRAWLDAFDVRVAVHAARLAERRILRTGLVVVDRWWAALGS